MGKFILSAFADEIDMDLKTQMDVLDTHGIKYIEMRGVNGQSLVDYSLAEVKKIKSQLDERDFKISAIGSPIGKIKITDDFASHLDKFKHTLEIAKIVDTKYIRMFSFYIPKDEDPQIYRDEVMMRWERFVEAAEGYSVVLLHENEKGIYGDTAERCLDIMKAMNCEYVRMTFDPANFVQCDEITYPKAFNMLKDYIAYMHIKDANYSDHRVVPSGMGDGKVPEIIAELKKMGYEGFLSIEPHLGSFQGFAALEPDSPGYDLTEGGPRLFAVAVQALKKILNSVEDK